MSMREMQQEQDGSRWQNRSVSLPGLRACRQNRGLTQRELGKLASVSTGTVYRLENARRGAYPVTVRKLAAALWVTPAHLVGDHRPQ
jgi:transcriptional regulator with XRE-family HTH domain